MLQEKNRFPLCRNNNLCFIWSLKGWIDDILALTIYILCFCWTSLICAESLVMGINKICFSLFTWKLDKYLTRILRFLTDVVLLKITNCLLIQNTTSAKVRIIFVRRFSLNVPIRGALYCYKYETIYVDT